jgi:ABC-2 type transport system ATP-binding protein
MNEMAITADHVIVIGKGKILADLPIKDLVERGNHNRVKVVTPDAELLQQAVGVAGGSIPGGFEVVSGAANTPSALGLTSASAAGVGSSLPLPGEAPTRLTRRERRTGTLPPVHAGGRAIYSLMVEGLTPAAIGQLSLINGVELHELTPQASTLEEAYMELTHDSVEYQSLALGGKTPASAAPKAVHSNSGDPYATL